MKLKKKIKRKMRLKKKIKTLEKLCSYLNLNIKGTKILSKGIFKIIQQLCESKKK